jgi:hypothetical protein
MGILSSSQQVSDPRGDAGDVEQAHRRIEELRALEQAEDTTRLNAQVPTELYDRFKAKCKAEGRSMSSVLREFLYAYVTD